MFILRFAFFVFALLLFQDFATGQLTYNELNVEYDSAVTFKNLQLIPVKFKEKSAKAGLNLLSLSDALVKHKIKLQEMQFEKGADVNWLQVTNHSKQAVIIQSGEFIAGGKQDRVIAETKIIAAGTTDYIHVFCVEKRRWDDKAKDFTYHGMVNSELRKAMDIKARQNEVWKEIDRQYAEQKKVSETWSYLNLYNDSITTDTAYINYFTKKYRETDSTFAGFIFITGDRIIGCELFSSPRLTAISFGNMLNSYIQSAILKGSTPSVAVNTMKEFMDKIISNEQSQKLFVTAHGRLHLYEGKIIHLVAYGD